MKRVYNMVQIVVTVVAVMTALCVVLLLVLGFRPYIVISGSMEPEIRTGSLCFVDHGDKDISKGDIIAYMAGEMTVVHRVIEETDEGYMTKGDNNDTADISPVRQNQIVGTYKFNIPGIGYILKNYRIAIIAATLFTAFCLLGIMINKRGEENE